MPVSETVTCRNPSSAAGETLTVIAPPFIVYLLALLSKLPITCAARVSSHRAGGRRGATVNVSLCAFSSNWGRISATTLSTSAPRSVGLSTSSIRPSITYDKRDNRLFPSRGFMLHGSWEWAPDMRGLLGHAVGDAVGGTFNFHRTTLYGRYYLPVGDCVPFLQGFVLKANATFGWIKQLNPKEPLPISEMYYVGGINTVRGYQLRSISPTVMVPLSNRPDANITPFNVGGDKQVIFNLELEFPIFEKVGIRGVLFADAGNAYAKGSPFFHDPQHDLPLGMFWSVGFGFRWFSPIGPLRFEWGIPLTPRSKADFLGGDPPILFEFTIGNSF